MFLFSDDPLFTDEELLLMCAASGGKTVEDTATGNPLTFVTDIARPLRSLTIPFTPIQSGTGDPSPENIRPILPWNGLTVFGGGKNLLNPAKRDNSYNNNIYFYRGEGLLLPAGTYTMSKTGENSSMFVQRPDGTTIANATNKQSFTFTLTESEAVVINYYKSGGINYEVDCQLEVGSSATAYEPYKPITETDIVFPSPVCGGQYEAVSGNLMSFYALLTKNTAEMNNNEDYPGWKNSGVENIIGTGVNSFLNNVLTNVSPVSGLTVGANTAFGGDVLYLSKSYFNKTQSEWKELAIDIQILIPLATPQEIQLTPTQTTTLIGDNTIWSDADGQMTAVYLKKG